MTDEPNKIELVFAELKSKGLLPPQRKLTSSKLTPTFRSAILFYNTISYNPKFCGMQEDNIRFSLLHEEGHKIRPQYGTPGVIFFIILALIPFLLIFIFYRDNPVFVYSSLIYSIIFVFTVIHIFSESFHGDEFDSDLFAAEILRDSYGIKKPSYILYNTLTEIYSIMYPKYPENVSIFYRIEYGLMSLHPSLEDRVKKVALLVDCY
jgi:hypothetical protein